MFLGGGRIASALVAGLRRSGYRGALVVHDRHPEKLRGLQRGFDVVAERDLQRAVAAARLLLIAVRPAAVSGLLAKIGTLHAPTIVVSLAAGIPLAKLCEQLAPPALWACAMPSPVCRSGRGLTAVAFDRAVPKRARNQVRELFARVGAVLEIPEKQFDIFTATYSVSHGYHALAALGDAAVKLGLGRETAFAAAAHALGDAIFAWRDGRGSLRGLLQEAATPGGVAAAVMATIDAAGYRRGVEGALRAGIKRARLAAR